MKVGEVLPLIGIITGEVSQSQLEGFKIITGVVYVEIDAEMQAI
ncbi:hypothetical protein [Microcoleus sp. herbarium12]